jgi:hypothetical protein
MGREAYGVLKEMAKSFGILASAVQNLRRTGAFVAGLI